MTFTVQSLWLPLVDHPSSRSSLYPHQAELLERWTDAGTILLASRTGTGKTRAAILPVLSRREWAVALYPTNELLRDQVRTVSRFSGEEGWAPLVLMPETWRAPDRSEQYGRAGHVLVPVDGPLLDRWQEVLLCGSRGETLRRLLNPDKPKIVFTNPDILFLILALAYHAEPFEALRRYETLVLDEFHLYQGVELAHALAMVALARGFDFFRRVVLLSATPPPETRELLKKTLAPTIIAPVAEARREGSGGRIAVHAVDVEPLQIAGGDSVEVLVSRIVALKPEIERLRREEETDDYIPAVVIVNSVVNAIRLEDRLVEEGFDRDSLAIVRGLSHRAIRDRRGKLLALGTSAIEVGVDFHCDQLIFEAWDAASFLQRFGRVGRHRPGKALALVPPNASEGMARITAEIGRDEFEQRIHTWYRRSPAHAFFVTTEHGLISARTLGENLIDTVARGGRVGSGVLGQLRQKIDRIFEEHAVRLGCEAQDRQAKTACDRARAGKAGARWVETYRRLNRFRTSLPGLRVHDFTEQHRRKNWEMGEYEADLATLLRRGSGLAWNGALGMLTVKGIGKHRLVRASEIFADIDCGIVLETKDFRNLLLYQDGESTPVSDLLARESHVFTVVRKRAVEAEVDWRLVAFEAGQYLVAFDGAALLLLEIARRTNALAGHPRLDRARE